MTPVVSVITPCYNGSAYITACIESVIAQTFQNWEMIIVDDCSTDDSAKIVKAYEQQDSRIKYICTPAPSGSPSTPRNIGIEHSHGEYIAFLDCDDQWLSRKLEEQLRFAVDNGYEFIYSDYEKVSHNGTRTQRTIRTRNKQSYGNALKTNAIPCLTAFVSRRIIGNIRFRNIPKEDYAFWLDILKKGITAHNTQIVHALYRELPVSRSSNKFSMVKEQWFILRTVEKIKIISALYCIVIYAIQGMRKYLI